MSTAAPFLFFGGIRVRPLLHCGKASLITPVATCLVGLGSNVGDRAGAIRGALERIAQHGRVTIQAASRLYQTRAVGGPAGQAAFLNAAALLETSLSPEQLLALLHATEQQLGRIRARRWGARTIDLDLLLYEQLVVETPALVLPHPRMAYRRFVLVPAVEIAAELVHPGTGWSLGRLLQHLDMPVDYVAIAGVGGAGKTRLADSVCQAEGWRFIPDPGNEVRSTPLHDDSAGLSAEAEIELLRLRAERLASAIAAGGTGQVLVSDFWFDQSVAYARQRLCGQLWNAFETAWRTARRTVVPPKLLGLLELPAERLLDCVRSAGGDSVDELQRLAADLHRQASLPQQGPLLRLSTADLDGAIAEVAAAIQAMRESVD